MPERIVLFAGPSAHGLRPSLLHGAGVELRPPCRRGDVDAWIERDAPPGVLVVCDGVFQVAPAVSHAELIRAIRAGWRVWGVSSIGAIRAHELRHDGMHGAGWVHGLFERIPALCDDEMCLLHFPETPHFPVTEALVNVRFALEAIGPRLSIGPEAACALVAGLRTLWFGDRTADAIRERLVAAGVDARAARIFLRWLRRHPVKSLDLAELLSRRPWQSF